MPPTNFWPACITTAAPQQGRPSFLCDPSCLGAPRLRLRRMRTRKPTPFLPGLDDRVPPGRPKSMAPPSCGPHHYALPLYR